jgi:hypothetical protein
VFEKAAGVSLKKLEPGYEEGGAWEREREGKSWMDGVTLREDAALRSEQEGEILRGQVWSERSGLDSGYSGTERANCLPLDCWKFKFENPGLLSDQMESLKFMLSLHFTNSWIALITCLERQLTWHFFQSYKEPGTVKPRFTVPRTTVSPDLPGLISFPRNFSSKISQFSGSLDHMPMLVIT